MCMHMGMHTSPGRYAVVGAGGYVLYGEGASISSSRQICTHTHAYIRAYMHMHPCTCMDACMQAGASILITTDMAAAASEGESHWVSQLLTYLVLGGK